MCVLSTDSSLNTNFQNGTAYECNRARMILIAYLCGSISSAILVCRLWAARSANQRLRQSVRNQCVTYRWQGAAVAVLIFDVLKGMLPVWGGI
ncbi:hypothetical protein DMI69_06620 [Escherichia coli]|nr:hypothetical protein [Escherichia coli]